MSTPKETTLKQLIKKAKFDRVNPDITDKNFPDNTKNFEKTELIHFGKMMSSEEVLKKLGEKNLRPATIKELVNFAIHNPEEQRKCPIVGLGSVWCLDGFQLAACLNERAGDRYLSLGWLGRVWVEYYRFLAVGKYSGHLDTRKDKLPEILKDLKEL